MDVRVDLLSESCGNAERYQDDVTVHPSLKASATGYRGGLLLLTALTVSTVNSISSMTFTE